MDDFRKASKYDDCWDEPWCKAGCQCAVGKQPRGKRGARKRNRLRLKNLDRKGGMG